MSRDILNYLGKFHICGKLHKPGVGSSSTSDSDTFLPSYILAKLGFPILFILPVSLYHSHLLIPLLLSPKPKLRVLASLPLWDSVPQHSSGHMGGSVVNIEWNASDTFCFLTYSRIIQQHPSSSFILCLVLRDKNRFCA